MSFSPKISVIIPLYNAASYIDQCVDSLLAQTLQDFEIIIIDDGSTDGSYEKASAYCSITSNVHVLRQQHLFAGAARNRGIEISRGDFLLFLDADDFFEPTLLEDSYKRITATGSDICVYKARSYNNQTGASKSLAYSCRTEICPQPVFNRFSNPKNIFCFTSPAPWTKLFRKSFIEKHGLRFEGTRSANDLVFVFVALALADRITTLDKELVNYRQQNSKSLQSSQHKDPTAFYVALCELKNQLQKYGLFEDLQQPLANSALDSCLHNLHVMKYDRNSHEKVFYLLKNEAFSNLGITGKSRDYFYVFPAKQYTEGQAIQNLSYEDYRKEYLDKPQTKKREPFYKRVAKKLRV